MRISEDSSSWKASGIIKRDFNQEHDAPEVPKRATNKNKRKDLKRWCRGKEGQEHDFKLNTEMNFAGYCYYKFKCSRCGKLKWR